MHLLLSTALIILTAGDPAPAPSPGGSEEIVLLVLPGDTLPQAEGKDPGRAFRRSLLHTLLPTPLLMAAAATGSEPLMSISSLLWAYGLYIGPCMGHFYAGNGACWRSVAVRAAMTGVAVGGLAVVALSVWDASGGGRAEAATGLGALLIVAGGAGVVGSAVWDIVKAPEAARRWNERHGITSAQLVPVLDPVRGGGGMAMRLRF